MYTLAISYWTTSNLPWFTDQTFQVPMQYCFFTASDFTFTTRYIQTWALFPLWLSLFIISGAISSLFSSSILGTWWVHSSVSCLFMFSYYSWGSQGKNAELVWHFIFQWTLFCQNSPPWPFHLGWSYTAWLSFIELDKAVIHVKNLVSFLWLWFSFCLPSDGQGKEACGSFLMESTDQKL